MASDCNVLTYRVQDATAGGRERDETLEFYSKFLDCGNNVETDVKKKDERTVKMVMENNEKRQESKKKVAGKENEKKRGEKVRKKGRFRFQFDFVAQTVNRRIACSRGQTRLKTLRKP